MEGTGYETRQTSKGHVIVMTFAWSRGINPTQSATLKLLHFRVKENFITVILA